MDKLELSKIELNEIEQLQLISKQTFFETFSDGNTEENMRKYLEEGFTLNKLKEELINPNSIFYFAKLSTIVVGYLKLNFGQAQTELKEKNGLEIERIYVLKDYHGKKIGQLLYNKAFEIAKDMNANYVWLGVWEENKKAIQFYKKNGFVEFDKHIFKLGDDEQTDLLMRVEIEKRG
jgi:diamine N-acetyltransferase